MLPIRKCIRRLITIRSSDPALSATQWVVTVTASGVGFRRKGGTESWGLSWRSIVGAGLIHESRPQFVQKLDTSKEV